MNKKEKLGITLMVIGHIIAFLMVSDVLSVGAMILNSLFDLSLCEVFLHSWGFRLPGIAIYGILFLTGGLIYKKKQ